MAEPNKVFCKLCYDEDNLVVSYGDATGTDTLQRHMSREHGGEFTDFEGAMKRG